MNASELGRSAEALAADLIAQIGMQVLARNVSVPDGEIDIIAREGETIVFIEVKARRTRRFGSALSAVDARKRKRLRASAENMLQFLPGSSRAVRFDVVTVEDGRATLHRSAF